MPCVRDSKNQNISAFLLESLKGEDCILKKVQSYCLPGVCRPRPPGRECVLGPGLQHGLTALALLST